MRSGAGWYNRARSDPLPIALEFHADFFVVHAQIAICARSDGRRRYCLHLLRNHTDIGLVAAVVSETVEADAAVEMTEQRNVMFQVDIGTAPAATTTTTTTAAASATTASAATGDTATSAASLKIAAAATAAEALMAAGAV